MRTQPANLPPPRGTPRGIEAEVGAESGRNRPDAAEWHLIQRGLVRITIVARLEVSKRLGQAGADLSISHGVTGQTAASFLGPQDRPSTLPQSRGFCDDTDVLICRQPRVRSCSAGGRTRDLFWPGA